MNSKNPDTLPTPADPNGRCPWCDRIAYFQVLDGTLLENERSPQSDRNIVRYANILVCHGCNKGTVCVTDGSHQGVFWWPTPGEGHLDLGVNPEVASAYDEGVRCLNIGANRAAAVMFRSALHIYVKDKGDEKAQDERHLKNALKHMKASGRLHESLADWADQLNQLGNEGAHPEDYDEVTTREASALQSFVRQLIKIEYEMPAELKRIKADALGEDAPSRGKP